MTAVHLERTAAETAVAVAFLAVTGRPADGAQEEILQAGGWTPLSLHAVNRLAHHAHVRRTAFTRTAGLAVQRSEQDPVQQQAAVLLNLAAQWPPVSMMPRLAWLTIVASTHDERVLADLVDSSHRIFGPSTVTRWTRLLGAEIAPLAYAAGLNLDEAEAEAAQAGPGTAERLRTLAALRGLNIDPTRLLAEAARAHPWLVG